MEIIILLILFIDNNTLKIIMIYMPLVGNGKDE